MIVDTWNYIIHDLCIAIDKFISESSYNIVYNNTNTLETLYSLLNDPDSDIIVDYSDGTLAGFAIVQRTNEFHSEYFGYLSKFYIMPEKRRTRSAFRVMDEVIDWFDARDCVVSFVSITGGVGADASFSRLMGKHGYKDNGSGMMIRNQYE